MLPHTDLVVSHSGSGTMLGALALGIPQVAAPRGTDQPENAALLARAGAGVVVAQDDYGEESLRAAIEQVTATVVRRTTRRVQAEIVAMPDADEAWARLSQGLS